jgi:hypothetical protein
MKTTRWVVIILALAFGGPLCSVGIAQTSPEQVEFFEKHVRPMLIEHCYRCHSPQAKRLKGGLRVDSRDALLKGGDNGPALVPGAPEKSRLIEAIGYKNVDLQMPPRARLPDKVIADLRQWVKMGAPWPGGHAIKTAAGKYEFDLARRKQEHWAWQAIHAPKTPAVRDTDWPLGPVDRFVLARLEDKGIVPAPPADRRVLIRRLYFDLIGLPPAPAEVDAFVRDSSPDAVETVVDRLLTSQHFGERWGRHWLDLVRYAESRGHEFDYAVPNAYQYRDYVIRALNADVPYNQFVQEHIAGDLLPRPRLHPAWRFNESILGTGFWFLGEQVHSPVDLCQDKADRFDNMIDVMGKTFLGLTVACARCHDHKFDAISTRDYYALCGFLESSSYRLVRFESLENNRFIAQQLEQLRAHSQAAIQKSLARDLRPNVSRLADYLLGARAAISSASRQTSDADRLAQIAQARKLEPVLLAAWVAHLRRAATDAGDPFHAFARVAAVPGELDAKHLAGLLAPLAEQCRRQSLQADAAVPDAEVVVDYSKSEPKTWIQDGFSFTAQRPGGLVLGGTADQPVVRFQDRGAAATDAFWEKLRAAPTAENEPGALGGYSRSGRTLRTPTFEVTAGWVYYLVQGSGHVYASVEAHVMIAGPLHASLVMPFKTGPAYQWVAQDLSPYKGRHVHIEFTPNPGADLAVVMVVQASKTPGMPDHPGKRLGRLLTGPGASSVEALAAGYQYLVTSAVDRLARDKLPESLAVAEDARLLNLLLHHPELTGLQQGRVGKNTADAVRLFLIRQSNLASQVQTESKVAPAILDGSATDEPVFIRGSYKTPGPLVPRRFLEALVGPERVTKAQGSGRLELARQMIDPAINPFLPRVMVNRVWHHLFGRGLVGSVDNFGVLGEAPTHPELLDYLADRFVRDGWSVKKLIRTLVLTRTYQMSSCPDRRAEKADPGNLLLHRMRLRRLEGEAIRDAMLAVSGQLKLELYGPSVPVHLTDFQQGRGRPASGPVDGAGRRSLYLSARRNFLSPFLLAFDTPTPFSTVGRRTVSNVPAQALILLNDPFVHQQANLWARRVVAEQQPAPERVSTMYLTAFGRPPTPEELKACLHFVARVADDNPSSNRELAAWTDLAHVLYNTKEFIYLP